MKITLSELRTLIRESVAKILKEDDIDYSLWKAPDIDNFWKKLDNNQRQTIAALLRPYNQNVVEFLEKEFDILKKPVGEMTDEEWELAKDARVSMITNSENQTLANIIRDENALEELKRLTAKWQSGREQKRAKEVASDLASRQTVNESKRTKK